LLFLCFTDEEKNKIKEKELKEKILKETIKTIENLAKKILSKKTIITSKPLKQGNQKTKIKEKEGF